MLLPLALSVPAAVLAAIQDGRSEYVLPAGIVEISAPIVVPYGTQDFAIRGAPEGTTLRAPKALPNMIVVGTQVGLVNSDQLKASRSYPVGDVADGATHLKDAGVSGYAVLIDPTTVAHSDSGQRQACHAELVRIVRAADGWARLDRPAAREYKGARLVPVTPCQGFSLSNVAFDGLADDGKRTTGFIALGISQGTTLSGLTMRRFGTRAVQSVLSRDLAIKGVTMDDGGDPKAPGSGYGVTLCLSRDVSVEDCSASKMRHAYLATNGTTDASFARCVSTGDGGFDTHGFDERRVSWTDCQSQGGWNLGNGAWMGGGKSLSLSRCSGGALNAGPNVVGSRIVDCAFKYAAFQSKDSSPKGFPNGGHPDDTRFVGGSLVGNDLVRGVGSMRVGSVSFERTALSGRLLLNPLAGSLFLKGCALTVSGGFAGSPMIDLSTPKATMDLSLSDCLLSSTGTLGIALASNYRGAFSAVGTTFGGAKKGVMLKDSRVKN